MSVDPPEDFQQFRDDVFLATDTLTENNVLEYFYKSQFYDSNSLNQRRRRGVAVLPNATGNEYRLVYANDAALDKVPAPPGSQWNFPNQFGVFVIQKFYKHDQASETPLDCYYVLGGTIFKAPFLGALVRRRMTSAIRKLETIFDELQRLHSWSLPNGYSWGKVDQIAELAAQSSLEDRVYELDLQGNELPKKIAGDASIDANSDLPGSRTADENQGLLALRPKSLFVMRPCLDASAPMEREFTKLVNHGLKFNEMVLKTRESMAEEEQAVHEELIALMQAQQ